MNVVIPMAGSGSRFVAAGYQIPKPFIPVKGKPMIEHVIDNIDGPSLRFFLLCRSAHLEHLSSTSLLNRDNISFVMVDQLTEGAACTVLRAKGMINSEEPLIIANSDQYVRYDHDWWLSQTVYSDNDGAIMTFPSNHPKWSYAATNEEGFVTRVAEKEVISEHATVGIYYYRRGCDFVSAAERMIEHNIRVNNEFYVCPAFNEMISYGAKVVCFKVDAMFGMGTPEDLVANYDHIGA